MAFFGTGYFTGFGIVTAESYPTAIRATAQGLTYNTGRLASAAAPFVVGSLADQRGFAVGLQRRCGCLPGGGVVVDRDPRDARAVGQSISSVNSPALMSSTCATGFTSTCPLWRLGIRSDIATYRKLPAANAITYGSTVGS